MRRILTSACLTVILMASGAMAQDEGPKPGLTATTGAAEQAAVGVVAFQASITPNVAVHDRSTRVEGLTLSLWGENQQTSLAVGLVNGTVGESKGASVGIFNYAETYTGLQWGFANTTEKDFTGWQGGPLLGLLLSGLNQTGGNMRGAQVGLINLAGSLTGLQFGIVNYTKTAESGVQIGVVNIISQNGECFSQWPNEVAPGMVLVNWRF